MPNLWEELETGPNPPEEIYAVVECLKGERNKYEYEKDIPGVVLVLVEDQTFPGCVIEARPVALMRMDDGGEQDDKVIAVPTEDPRYDHVEDIEDVPHQQRKEIEEFFETYKNLEANKRTEVLGWENSEAAMDAIEHAQDLYDEQFD